MTGLLHAERDVMEAPGVDRLGILAGGNHITREQRVVAARLVADCEAANRELYASRDQDSRNSMQSIMVKRITARDRVERLEKVLGPKGTELLTCIVLRNRTLGATSKVIDVHEKAVLPMLQLALEVVEGFYAVTD